MSLQQKLSTIRNELGEKAWGKLFAVSNVRGFFTVFEIWASIFLSLWLLSVWPNFLTLILCLIVIGSRQTALGLATHEAMHGMLFKSRRVNDFIGKWFCAVPVWLNFDLYRIEHLDHHKYLGTDRDPDIGFRKPFPLSTSKWVLSLLMNLLGITAPKRFRRRIKMDFGYSTYSVTTNSKPILTDMPLKERATLGIRNIAPHLLSLGVITLLLTLMHFPEGILIYILAFYTTLGVIFQILQVSQHAATPESAPLVPNVRTILLNPIVNWIFFPLNANLHIEHHALMKVPYYRLKKLNRELAQRELIGSDQLSEGLTSTMEIYCD